MINKITMTTNDMIHMPKSSIRLRTFTLRNRITNRNLGTKKDQFHQVLATEVSIRLRIFVLRNQIRKQDLGTKKDQFHQVLAIDVSIRLHTCIVRNQIRKLKLGTTKDKFHQVLAIDKGRIHPLSRNGGIKGMVLVLLTTCDSKARIIQGLNTRTTSFLMKSLLGVYTNLSFYPARNTHEPEIMPSSFRQRNLHERILQGFVRVTQEKTIVLNHLWSLQVVSLPVRARHMCSAQILDTVV